jgi:hypothetical protein
MPRMSDAVASQALLAELETGRATGCLTINSSTGLVGHVYLLMGRPFHAVSPSGEGQVAMAEALNWPDVALSFDERAQLPARQTITTPSMPVPDQRAGSDQLETDPRIFAMSCMSLGGAVLTIVAPIGVLLIGLALHAEWTLPVSLSLLFVFMAVWIAGAIGFRIMFLREAVKVSGGPAKVDIPRVIDAPSTVITGEPELVVKMVTRCLTGRVGKCRLEFYPEGLQICRDRNHPEPRWLFAYADLKQAELVDVVANGRVSVHQYYVRLIAARPRMAFLFGSQLSTNQNAKVIYSKLADHKVPTSGEELDC